LIAVVRHPIYFCNVPVELQAMAPWMTPAAAAAAAAVVTAAAASVVVALMEIEIVTGM